MECWCFVCLHRLSALICWCSTGVSQWEDSREYHTSPALFLWPVKMSRALTHFSPTMLLKREEDIWYPVLPLFQVYLHVCSVRESSPKLWGSCGTVKHQQRFRSWMRRRTWSLLCSVKPTVNRTWHMRLSAHTKTISSALKYYNTASLGNYLI